MATTAEIHADSALALETLSKIENRNYIYGMVRHVTASGMTRKMSFFAVIDGELSNITWAIGKALGYKVGDYNGFNVLTIGGVGMDMIFKVVYDLGQVLHNDGYYYANKQI
jgi:hypothetical protein